MESRGTFAATVSAHYSNTATHQTLLARLAASRGDLDPAWGEFVDRYGELIRRFCRGRGLQNSDADDVLQDVLLSLSKAMPGFRYDPSRGKFRSYLKTVTIHAIFARSRQTQGATGLEDIESLVATATGDPQAEARWEQEWRQYHLRQAMQRVQAEFTSRDVAAFERYALRGESPEVVARESELSMDALYQIKSRILKRMSQVISTQVEEEG